MFARFTYTLNKTGLQDMFDMANIITALGSSQRIELLLVLLVVESPEFVRACFGLTYYTQCLLHENVVNNSSLSRVKHQQVKQNRSFLLGKAVTGEVQFQ